MIKEILYTEGENSVLIQVFINSLNFKRLYCKYERVVYKIVG